MKRTMFSLMLFVVSLFVIIGCGKSSNEQQDVTTEAKMTDSQNTTEVVSEESDAEQNSPDEMPMAHDTCVLDEIESTGDKTFVCAYEGVKHDFIVEKPSETENAPLVLMLHGYGESAEGFRQKVAFEKDANEKGYVVVYVTGAPSPEDATSANGWNSGIGVSSNKDVEFLCALVNYLCDTYSLDKDCVFAVGFSNGAFMTHRLALEANDTFAAVVSVAGMMPESVWEAKPEMCAVSVFQITGEKDDVVPKNSDGSAKFSKAPAIEEVVDYYVVTNALALTETVDIGKKSILKKYTSQGSTKQVWDLFIPDGRHSWPEEQITGINTNQLILDFLDTQRQRL